MTETEIEITADDILGHLTGNLMGDRLYNNAGDRVIAILECPYGDETILACEPDVYPTEILGRFRVTVEQVE